MRRCSNGLRKRNSCRHEKATAASPAGAGATRTHTGGIVARMLCFRRTAIWFSASWPKTLANISIKFWMQSCGLYHIKRPKSKLSPPKVFAFATSRSIRTT